MRLFNEPDEFRECAYGDIWYLDTYIKRETTCIYGLIVNGEVVYVGQTYYIKQRLQQHARHLIFDKAQILVYYNISFQELCSFEYAWIDEIDPILNGMFIPFENNHGGGAWCFEKVLTECIRLQILLYGKRSIFMNLIWVFEAFDDNNKSEGKFGIYCNGKKLATELIDERIRKRFDHHVNIKFVDGYDDKRKDDDATRVKKVLDLFHEGLVIL